MRLRSILIRGVYLIEFIQTAASRDAGRYRQGICLMGSVVCYPWVFIHSVGGSTVVQAASRFGNIRKQAVGGNVWVHRPWAVASLIH